MNNDLDKLDLSSLRNAVDSLFQSLEIVGNEAWFSAQTIAVRNTLTAGVIQNFEFFMSKASKCCVGSWNELQRVQVKWISAISGIY